MGIVNVTPDSFSDGGLHASTGCRGRPRARPPGPGRRHHRHRVASPRAPERRGPWWPRSSTGSCRSSASWPPTGAVVSVDTMRSEVAAAALEAGARVVNDVSGGLADPRMLEVVADSDAHYVAMHWRGHSDRMADLTDYPDGVVETVRRELGARRDACEAAGIGRDRLVLDPGLGFAKVAAHNWELLACLDVLDGLGCPLLVGASRKSFLGALLAEDGRAPPGGRAGARPRGAGGVAGPAGCGRPARARRPSDRGCPPGRGRDVGPTAGGRVLAVLAHGMMAAVNADRDHRRARRHRHRVLRPPRRLRLREARGPGLPRRPRPRLRHPCRGCLRRPRGHRQLRQPGPRCQGRRRTRPG